jgi:hypothetical protein
MEVILNGKELYAKLEVLTKVKADGENWKIYYLDESTNEKWVIEYPNSEYHGGGAPQLRLIDKFPFE